jgi:hypothetical protein
MSVVVEFEAFPVKRCTIKTTPSMLIQHIISQACSAFNITENGYVLLHKKQELQGSLSVRFANIPNGSKLNLIYKGIGNLMLNK